MTGGLNRPRVLVAVPTCSSSIPALNGLLNVQFNGVLDLAFLVNHKIDFSSLSNRLKERFRRVYVLRQPDTGYPIQNLMLVRNYALNFARENGYDAVWFVDSDIIVKPEYLELLWNVNASIVGGYYEFRKTISTKYYSIKIFSFIEKGCGNCSTQPPRIHEPFEVSFLASGCMLVKRKALENPKLDFTLHNLEMGEDGNFCLKAGKLGYKIVLHPSVYCKHMEKEIKVSDIDSIAVAAALICLIQKFEGKIFFWGCRKKIKKKLIHAFSEPDFLKLLPEQYTSEDFKIILALQTNVNEFLLLSGWSIWNKAAPEEELDTILFSPPVPVKFSLFEKRYIVMFIHLMIKYFPAIEVFLHFSRLNSKAETKLKS